MGAIKSNIRKVLAAFLCACLLVTYNPAVGSNGTAFADENGVETYSIDQNTGHLQNIQDDLNKDSEATKTYSGDAANGITGASTTVNVMTFDNTLETACGGSSTPMVATLQQLKEGKADSRDVSYIWFEITGGTQPYTTDWQVLVDGKLDTNITSYFTNPNNNAITSSSQGNVTTYRFDLMKYAKTNQCKFEADHTYSFVGLLGDSAENRASASCQVTLYILSQNTNVEPFSWGVIRPADNNTDLQDVDVEAMRSSQTTLIGGIVPSSDAVNQAMQNKVAAHTMEQDTSDYVLGNVLQLGVYPAMVPDSDKVVIPSFVSDNMIVRLPIDANRTGDGRYEEGSTITVLWTADGADEIVSVPATVVHRSNDNATGWYAELVYPFSGSSNGMGLDGAKGWQALPGYFAIEYDTKKLPAGDEEKDKAHYFSVETNVKTSGGTVTPTGVNYWQAGSDTNVPVYGLKPMEGYKLSELKLTRTDNTYDYYDFLGTSDIATVGTLSKYLNTLALNHNNTIVFQKGSTWRLDVSFAEDDNSGSGGGGGTTPVEPQTHRVTVNVTGDVSEGAGVVLYYEEDGNFVTTPANGKPGASPFVDVLSTTPVCVSIIEPGPKDGFNYVLDSITMNGEPQILENPFVVPVTPVDVTPENITVTVKFVKTSSGFTSDVPTYSVTAKVADVSASLGTATLSSGMYRDNMALGPTITFEGTEDTYYVDYLDVTVGENPTTRIDVNPDMEADFDWVMPNYHANVDVVAYFSDKASPTIEVTLKSNGHGSIVPLGTNATTQSVVMVRSGEKFPLSFVADEGYEFDKVQQRMGSGADEDVPSSQMMGTIWNFTPTDDRTVDQRNGLLKIVVTASFKQKNIGSTTPGEGDKTQIPQQVNVYVADEALDDAANPNLAYLFDPPKNKNFISDDDDAIADPKAAVSVAGYHSAQGVANGQTSILTSVAYGGTYPMTLKGKTLPVAGGLYEDYGIAKVLVVSYKYGTDASGNQVKQGMTWRLYNWNVPYFSLTNVTADTDVVVYFAPVEPKEGSETTNPYDPTNPVVPNPNGPGGGFDTEEDFVNVTVKANAADMVTPSRGTTTPVLKGGQLPMKFVTETSEYALDTAVVEPQGGTIKDIKETLLATAAAANSKTADYLLSNVMVDTEVRATYTERTAQEATTYDVNALVYTEDENGFDISNSAASCSIKVASGANYSTSVNLANGASVSFVEGSNLRLTLQRGSGFKLDNLKITWDNAGVYAYVVESTLSDNSVKRTIHFTTNRNDLLGKQQYVGDGKSDLYADGAPDANTAVWFVENLQCPITFAPAYKKVSTTGGSTGTGNDDPTVDPNDPNHPDNPNNPKNSWTVTTLVGTGLGQIYTDSPNYNGSITRVPKDNSDVSEATPLTIFLVPATGYRIADVKVEGSTGNPLLDIVNFWANAFGWNDDATPEEMAALAKENRCIKLTDVTQNYKVTVDFETIPGEFDQNSPLADQVAVNVVYDPARGSVTPNLGLTTTKDGKQQFTASPMRVGDKFFSVVAVKVSVGDKTETVQAIDKSSDLVRWGDVYYNTFLVDFSKLKALYPAWASKDSRDAVTVEVQFSDTADTPVPPGSGGNVAPGTPDPDNPPDSNDPDDPNSGGGAVKSLTVNLVTDGEPEANDNGIGGVVSPRGTFTLATFKNNANEVCSQQITVAPYSDYKLDKIVVERDGTKDSATSYLYKQELTQTGSYFSVSPEPAGNETVTIYLVKKPLSERSYSLEVVASGVSNASSYVSPVGTMTLNNTGSQTISINPATGVRVQTVTDKYKDASGNWKPLPAEANGDPGVTWSRGSSTEALNGVTVKPIKVNGKVADRQVTVTFQNSTGTDHSVADKDKTNIQVQAIGSGAGYLIFKPSQNMTDVWKGTDDDPVTYNYSYMLSKQAISQGYAIYRVQVNGDDKFMATDVSELVYEGEYAFTTDNFRAGDNSINTLFVYVKQFKDNGSGNGGGGTGTNPSDPNKPGTNPTNPLDPVEPSPDDAVTLEYGCGDGGTITLKDVSDTSKTTGTKGMKSVQVGKEDLFTVVMTPDSKHVMSAVYLNNCIMREFNWVEPGDGRTVKVALEYTLEVDDPDMPARVFAVFKQGSNNTFKPWDATQVGNSSFATDSKFRVEVSPSIGVEALVEMVDDPTVAGDMLSMQEPVAPFTPEVSAAEDDGYVLEYDTISKLSNGKNVRILVGPLIKWNEDDNGNSTLYALDQIEGLQDGYTVTEKPLASRMLSSRSSLGADGDGVDEQADKQRYYTYYEINGKLPDSAVSEQADEGSSEENEPQTPVVRLNLRELSLSEGLFPEYRISDIDVPLGSVLVNASVNTSIGSGTITPVAVPGTFGTPWFGDNMTGPWIIPADTKIAFKVEPAEGFVLDSLSVNNTDAARWFDGQTNTLTLTPSGNMDIVARFVAEDSADAMRTVTIEIVNAYGANTPHGTTDPAPGVRQVKKGSPLSITFQPDQRPVRYVPYYIWISGDNMESYEGVLSPQQSGWILPASWNDQTIRVQYAPEGTTPSGMDYLVQTGQNLANQMGNALVKTGDNPWLPVIVLLLLLAGGAAFGAKRFLGASESASRVAKYSVTKREVRRDEDDKE